MNIVKAFNRQSRYIVTAAALVFATFLPALVSAAQVNERSIALSNSSVSATNVTYTVNFTPVTSAAAFVVDFCSNSPTLGQVCDIPAGFNATSAASTTANFTDVSDLTANTIRVTGPVTAATAVAVDITGITNPSTAGALYARIVTFDTAGNANLYESEEEPVGMIDNGGVAMSITPTIGVSGSVLESLIFCASGTPFQPLGCADTTTPPNVPLGTNGVLDNVVSDGTIYTQISTNAATGAVVNLKSNTVGCGGLTLAGATGAAACNIKPVAATAGPIANDTAQFGMRFGTIDDGTGTIGTAYGYTSSANYFMNYVVNDQTGVTSTYGDPIYDTDGKPVSNAIVPLIFGANIGNDTPAGSYSATLNLIATGKF